MSFAANCIPILISLPLFVWLGGPWRLEKGGTEFNNNLLITGAVLFTAGTAGNLTFLLAVSWTVFLWSWLGNRTRCRLVGMEDQSGTEETLRRLSGALKYLSRPTRDRCRA